eukprot:1151364-Pelagomonas_calceolata.AAC.4
MGVWRPKLQPWMPSPAPVMPQSRSKATAHSMMSSGIPARLKSGLCVFTLLPLNTVLDSWEMSQKRNNCRAEQELFSTTSLIQCCSASSRKDVPKIAIGTPAQSCLPLLLLQLLLLMAHAKDVTMD